MEKNGRRSGISTFFSFLFIPLSLIYYEILLKLLTGQHFLLPNICAMVLTSVAAGSIFYLIFTLFRSNKVSRWLALLFLEIAALLFLLSYFVFDSFKVFNDIQTIAEGAGGIAKEFGSAVWSVILKGYGIILLYEIPVILFILFFFVFHILHLDQAKRRTRWILLLVFLVFEASGILLMMRNDNYARRLTRNYNFNLVTQSFSLQTAYKTDALYLVFGNPFRSSFYSGYQYLDDSSSDGITYGIQELDLTFPETTNKKIKKMNDYVSSLTPSSRNEYTGIFKGKNIIFISAESLSSEVIRPDLTPTLYKLKTEGIQFENYYQPYYNSSTATGEFANLMGLVPTSGMRSFTSTIGKELYFTIGNETLRQGYHNIAYHNGTVEYYKRYLTHPNFGYSDFIAQGNGMEEGLSGTWPESDLEMFQYSLPQYIDQEPFCIYYMTLTAHFPYYKDLSVMTDQYGSLVENMGYSDVLEAYFTDMIDFDRGLAYLLDELENKKIADDTVLVISPDHFPYGLTKSDSYGTDKDYLPELFGFDPANEIERDHNSLIIWSKSLEKKAPIIVSEPVYSVDILPTLLNLFDLDYDSRLLAGRDVFSDALPLVIWPDYSWVSDKGYYLSETDTFVQKEGTDIPDDYLQNVQIIVSNKMNFSSLVLEEDYYRYLFP